jgi:TRAP-type mannitol/chloroaromatic compound transport system permease small subunit
VLLLGENRRRFTAIDAVTVQIGRKISWLVGKVVLVGRFTWLVSSL